MSCLKMSVIFSVLNANSGRYADALGPNWSHSSKSDTMLRFAVPIKVGAIDAAALGPFEK